MAALLGLDVSFRSIGRPQKMVEMEDAPILSSFPAIIWQDLDCMSLNGRKEGAAHDSLSFRNPCCLSCY
jgi:hypothetical protein